MGCDSVVENEASLAHVQASPQHSMEYRTTLRLLVPLTLPQLGSLRLPVIRELRAPTRRGPTCRHLVTDRVCDELLGDFVLMKTGLFGTLGNAAQYTG